MRDPTGQFLAVVHFVTDYFVNVIVEFFWKSGHGDEKKIVAYGRLFSCVVFCNFCGKFIYAQGAQMMRRIRIIYVHNSKYAVVIAIDTVLMYIVESGELDEWSKSRPC